MRLIALRGWTEHYQEQALAEEDRLRMELEKIESRKRGITKLVNDIERAERFNANKVVVEYNAFKHRKDLR